MSTTFERCDKSVDDLAGRLIREHREHGLLHEFKVKIDFVFAYRNEEDGPALKHHGRAALAIARKMPLKDRGAWPRRRGDCD